MNKHMTLGTNAHGSVSGPYFPTRTSFVLENSFRDTSLNAMFDIQKKQLLLNVGRSIAVRVGYDYDHVKSCFGPVIILQREMPRLLSYVLVRVFFNHDSFSVICGPGYKTVLPLPGRKDKPHENDRDDHSDPGELTGGTAQSP